MKGWKDNKKLEKSMKIHKEAASLTIRTWKIGNSVIQHRNRWRIVKSKKLITKVYKSRDKINKIITNSANLFNLTIRRSLF